jgi:4-diphosphocytidyl-2C-methyl-D-erythritol kinase
MTKSSGIEPLDSYAKSISNFMNWAAERIAKEVEDNERIEEQAGTREFIPGSGRQVRRNYTTEEKAHIVSEIDKLRAHGLNPVLASRELGIYNSTYYAWKRKLNK